MSDLFQTETATSIMRHLDLQNRNRPICTITHWMGQDMIDWNPPYQRGEVWGEIRQRNLIKSVLMGIPISAIILNDRSKDEAWGDPAYRFMAVIDGKQRMTAIAKFLCGHMVVPGEWFGLPDEEVSFPRLPIGLQRRFENIPLAFYEASVGTLEQEQEVFDLVNYGGIPQGESDL